MNQDFIIRLTIATHKVADILPEEEALRPLMKKAADDILVSLIVVLRGDFAVHQKRLVRISVLQQRIETILEYFSQVQNRTAVHPSNFLLLRREYTTIYTQLEGLLDEFSREREKDTSPERESGKSSQSIYFRTEKREKDARKDMPVSLARGEAQQTEKKQEVVTLLNDRQKKIVAMLVGKDRIQVQELQKIMPQVTKRTLRRDLDSLLRQNKIERLGEWNNISYRLKA